MLADPPPTVGAARFGGNIFCGLTGSSVAPGGGGRGDKIWERPKQRALGRVRSLDTTLTLRTPYSLTSTWTVAWVVDSDSSRSLRMACSQTDSFGALLMSCTQFGQDVLTIIGGDVPGLFQGGE